MEKGALNHGEGGSTNLENNHSGVEVSQQGSPLDGKAIGGAWTTFIDNLSKRVSRFALRELFGHYRKVTRVFIPAVNKKAKYYKQYTFAFISMACKEDMLMVISKLNNTRIDGRIISVSQAKQEVARNPFLSKGNGKDNNIYCGSREKESRVPLNKR
ncbi:hypothetical protein HRI_004720300 [Hibiscus trionum]|uniref:RRM domain-containing protein n=1 Tax=Hibiscus trionum TaxID=183268 RepID=A0A9W7MV46_HIBTR|nr:hypothetical protein HRI_004720300 [Hibiscus trionum]